MNLNTITIKGSIVLFMVLNQISGFSQCATDEHSTNSQDAWQSCQLTENPNPSRGNSHWIQYDLGYVYDLGQSTFWNYNVGGETGKGFRNTAIDYSTDGINLTTAVSFELLKAN